MKKKLRMSLTIKMTSAILLLLSIVFTVIIVSTLNQLKSISVDKGELEAKYAATAFAAQFYEELNGYKQELDTMAIVLRHASEKQLYSREEVIHLLEQMLQEHPELLGVYSVWEPNAFDGKDAENKNKNAYHDETGRLVPYVVREGDGFSIEAVRDYETVGSGDFYLVSKNGKEPALIEPYKYVLRGEEIPMTTLVVPILNDKDEFLGVIGFDISLDSLQSKASQVKPLGGYVNVISGQGKYVANSEQPEKILELYADEEDKAKLLDNVISETGMTGYIENVHGEQALSVFTAITLEDIDNKFYVEAVIPEKEVLKDFNESKMFFIIMGIVSMYALAVILIILTRIMIIRPIKRFVTSVQKMSEGDLTQHVEVKSRDEIGQMSESFNHMTSELRGMFHLVADLSMSVGATSEELTASADQTSKASETIARNIEEVAAGSELQNRYAGETAVAMNEMSAGIERVTESSASVLSFVNDIVEQTKLGNIKMHETEVKMKDVLGSSVEAGKAIQMLEEHSKEIGGIVSMISQISSQTNLLALNANIEAARAGEFGRGFSVVAAEIRKLADQSQKATAEIAQLIARVQADTSNVAAIMVQNSEDVTISEQHIIESADLFQLITDKMESVGEQMQEVSAASEQMNASVQQVNASAHELSRIAGEATDNSQSVASASEEQLASMEEIASASATLSDMVQELLEKLSKFKIS